MKKVHRLLSLITLLFSSVMLGQLTEGLGTVTYADGNVKVAGQKTFWSANPKKDTSTTDELLTVHYKSLYNRRNRFLSGIMGTIDNADGYIQVDAYAYDNSSSIGLQSVRIDRETKGLSPIYSVRLTQSSTKAYDKESHFVQYQYSISNNNQFKAYGVQSDDIKALSAQLKNAYHIDCGGVANWFRSAFGFDESCEGKITEDMMIYLEDLPVVVKITLKDATLHDARIPALDQNRNLKRIIERDYPYRIIKKVKVTVLEAPEDNHPAQFYEQKARDAFNWANKVYTASTGKNLPAAAEAQGIKIGNPRIVFRDIDIIIKKGEKSIYYPPERSEIEEIGYFENNVNNSVLKIKTEIPIFLVKRMYLSPDDKKESPNSLMYFSAKKPVVEDDNSRLQVAMYTLISYDGDVLQEPIMTKATITHELGHYLGLEHPFDDRDLYACLDGDHISHTPITDGRLPRSVATWPNPVYDCNTIAPSHCGHRRLIENVMDYFHQCSFMFTPGQAKILRNTLYKNKYYSELSDREMSKDREIDKTLRITVTDLRTATDRLERSVGSHNRKTPSLYIFPSIVSVGNNVKAIINNPLKEHVEATLQVNNLNGKFISSRYRLHPGKNKLKLRTAHLKKGMYSVRLITNTSVIGMLKGDLIIKGK